MDRLIPKEALKKLARTCESRTWEGDVGVPREVLLKEVPRMDAFFPFSVTRSIAPPAGAPKRFETLVKKHPEFGQKRIPTTTFPKKAAQKKGPSMQRDDRSHETVKFDSG